MPASAEQPDVASATGAQRLWTVVVVVIGIVASFSVWQWERLREASRLERALEYRATNFTAALRAELARYERILAAARAVHAAQPAITHETWRQLAASLDLARNYPAIQAVFWQPRVRPPERAHFSRWASLQNGAEFELRPPGDREEFFPIVFVEPRTWRNERLIGLDGLADQARRTTMERVRDEAGVALSPPLTIDVVPQEVAKTGFIMMVPIYGGGEVPAEITERRRRHVGFAAVSFRVTELLHGITAREFDGVVIQVTSRADGRLLYGPAAVTPENGLRHVESVVFGGQVLDLAFGFAPEYMDANRSYHAYLTLVAGLVVTLLATLLVLNRTNALIAVEARALAIAANLSKSEERYSLAMETTTDGLWEQDLTSRRTRVSPRFEALLGYAPGSFERLGIDPADLLHPADRFRQREALQAHLKDHAPYVCEVRMRAADGHYVWVHAHGRAQRDESGNPVRIFGSIADVSDLHAALDRFRDLSRLASDWFWEQDENYRFTSFSDSATPDHPGGDRSALIGKTLWELATGSDPAEMAAHRAVVEAHKAFREFEYRVVSEKGETWWYSVNGKPLFDDNGRFVGYRGTSRDVTVRRRLEEELRKHRDNLSALVEAQTADLVGAKEAAEAASRSKSEFLANMSHELRTPMHAVLSFARIGRDRVATATPAKLGEYFDRILTSGERLLEMVNSLLDLSKLEAGKMPLDTALVDLAGIVREVMNDLEAMIDGRRLHVDVIGADGDTVVSGDARGLGQVVRNLLSNVLKFAPEGSRLSIEFVADELPAGRRAEDTGTLPALRMTVSDEGPGIPDDELEAVFDKFYQSSKTRTGAGGTGLGLAICREIVTAHRGTIRARNRPGGGAAFDTVLPRGPRE